MQQAAAEIVSGRDCGRPACLYCPAWQRLCDRSGGGAQLSVAALIVFGVANRILYKLALVPMGDYVFFLAQFQTFGYCAVYFTALYVRYQCAALPCL